LYGKAIEGEDMKRLALLQVVLAVVPLLMAMGVYSGEGSPDKIPIPEKKFSVTFVDQMDMVVQCQDASIEGKTFIEGKKGEGVYTVDFDRISLISFRMQENRLYGGIVLKDGSSLELMLNNERKAYGRTKYGTFQVKLSSLKRMVLH
jgi:hypothetical protein